MGSRCPAATHLSKWGSSAPLRAGLVRHDAVRSTGRSRSALPCAQHNLGKSQLLLSANILIAVLHSIRRAVLRSRRSFGFKGSFCKNAGRVLSKHCTHRKTKSKLSREKRLQKTTPSPALPRPGGAWPSRTFSPSGGRALLTSGGGDLRAVTIVAENCKSFTVSPSESVFHRSESVSETVNRYRFTV